MQGQNSVNTPVKIADFERFAMMHLRMVKGIIGRGWAVPHYTYIDLHAGCGYNHACSMDGSPLVLAKLARRLMVPVRATLFESNPDACAELEARLAPFQDPPCAVYEVVCGDHAQTFPPKIAHLSSPAKRAYGLAYSDPNDTRMPLPLLQMIAEKLPRVDILTHISATAIKRARGVFKDDRLRLSQIIEAPGKTRIILRQPCGQWQWTMALLTNWEKFPDRCEDGFFDVTSETGRALLLALDNPGTPPPVPSRATAPIRARAICLQTNLDL